LVTETDLIARKEITADQIASMKESTAAMIASVVEQATQDPNPELSAMFKNIYAESKGK
jgi:TPP-dependent pyruvate/acetoin dehydrogenase alpha subunit